MEKKLELINKCMEAIAKNNPDDETPDTLLFTDDYSIILGYMNHRYYLPGDIAADDYEEIEAISDELGTVFGSFTDTLNIEAMLDSDFDEFAPQYFYVFMDGNNFSVEEAEEEEWD